MNVSEQTAAQAAAGVRARKIFLAESACLQQCNRQRVTQRQRCRGAGRGRQPERAGLFRHMGVKVHIGLARQ